MLLLYNIHTDQFISHKYIVGQITKKWTRFHDQNISSSRNLSSFLHTKQHCPLPPSPKWPLSSLIMLHISINQFCYISFYAGFLCSMLWWCSSKILGIAIVHFLLEVLSLQVLHLHFPSFWVNFHLRYELWIKVLWYYSTIYWKLINHIWIVNHVNYMDHRNHPWVRLWIFCCVHQSIRTILQFSHRLDNYSCAVNLEIKQCDLFCFSKLVFLW